MKPSAAAGLTALALLTAAGPALAKSPFDGTWKADLSSADFGKHPSVLTLKDGLFTCSSCLPPYSVKADGAFHPVKDEPTFDEESVRVVNASTIEQVDRKGGRVVSTAKISVAPDGKTATVAWTDTTNASAPAVSGKQISSRVAAAPPGAHATSGSWVTQSLSGVSEAGLTITVKIDRDTLSFSTPTGQSYVAKLDGTEAPFKGDPGVTSVKVRKISDRELEESDLLNGKVITVIHMTLSSDDKELTTVFESKRTNARSSIKSHKV